MKIDYVSGITGVPLGFTFALVLYALVYYKAMQERKNGLYIEDRKVEADAITLIGIISVLSASLVYYFRKQPCRSSLYGGVVLGCAIYALAMRRPSA